MYHECSNFIWDKIEEIKRELKESERLQQWIDELIIKKTNVLIGKLIDVKERKIDWHFNSDEAIKLGFINEVI
jgi:ATP-dependent protease ClpP protease subunit